MDGVIQLLVAELGILAMGGYGIVRGRYLIWLHDCPEWEVLYLCIMDLQYSHSNGGWMIPTSSSDVDYNWIASEITFDISYLHLIKSQPNQHEQMEDCPSLTDDQNSLIYPDLGSPSMATTQCEETAPESWCVSFFVTVLPCHFRHTDLIQSKSLP